MEVVHVELFSTILAGGVFALFTAIQTWVNKGRFDAIDRRLELLAAEMAQLRSDLLQVALASRPHQQTG